jgi:HEPN domain-containing protein
MQHDPALLADVRAWLHKAKQDILAGRYELTAKPPFTADAVFHAQQAAEKSLKGLLASRDIPFGKTHNIMELGEACTRLAPELRELLGRAATLTAFAWMYRYPGSYEDPTAEQAVSALVLAQEVFDAVASRVPEAARP